MSGARVPHRQLYAAQADHCSTRECTTCVVFSFAWLQTCNSQAYLTQMCSTVDFLTGVHSRRIYLKVEAISADKPLEDFHLMMKRTDGTEGSGRWVRQAMQGMQDLIQTSVLNGDAKTGCTSLLTALECARALRKACVGENIHEVFNELLQNLAKQYVCILFSCIRHPYFVIPTQIAG